MIDIHCHLLPEIDDGAQSLEEAVAMARMASLDGITDIIVTPHTHDGLYQHSLAEIEAATNRLQKELEQRDVAIHLHPGAEVHIHLGLLGHIDTGEVVTLCNQRKYLLLELPFLPLPTFTDQLIDELLQAGITPIIAHPERIEVLRLQPERLARWVEKGAISQVTADSLTGRMGKATKQVAENLIRQRLVHLIASDAHHVRHRRPEISQAFAVLQQLVSSEDIARFHSNAEAVLSGTSCSRWEVAAVREKKWWFW